MESVPARLILSRLCDDCNKKNTQIESIYRDITNGIDHEDCEMQRAKGEMDIIIQYLSDFSKFVDAEIVRRNDYSGSVKWKWKEI